MIKSIELVDAATFKQLEKIQPNKINYLFGGNGTGKTTLGKVINDCDLYPQCNITWKSGPVERIVYNKNFVEENFSQSDSIKGIFTLGKDSTDSKKKIEETRTRIDEVEDDIVNINNQIEKKKTEFTELKKNFIERVWNFKDEYIDHFKPAYRGYLGSKKSFFEKCLSEIGNDSPILEKEKIIEKCDQIFSELLTSYDTLEIPDFSSLIGLQEDQVLKEKIIGKEDVEIGKLIEKLDNSDWVKQGLGYLNLSGDVCPFCQQEISVNLKAEIENFFDETYRTKIQQIENLLENYRTSQNGVLSNIDQIIQQDIPILDFTELSKKKNFIDERIKNNAKTIDDKLKNPSIPVSLEPINEITSEISGLIIKYNEVINKNNEVVENIDREKENLINQIWKFTVENIKHDIESYSLEKTRHSKAINGLSETLQNRNTEKLVAENSVRELESKITSVQYSVNEINKLLNSFGFTNFKLQKAKKKGFYELVRDDGQKVGQTLSEGEYTFITFLYFYHLLKGSTEETGVTKNKIVVIDDPISSLDSSVLFVVSNLIKSIIRDAKEDKNGIKQIFILTHNVYFFKEVTFRSNRDNKWKEESYWLVQKHDKQSRIIEHEDNPIKTTYELLWRELDESDKINTATIFNTMRRILEYYFNILGNLDYAVEALKKFEGEEKLICKSLVGWINDGSHFINDDLAVTVDSSDIHKYLKVFKDIFYKMDHGSHYEMMTNKTVTA